MAISRKDVPTTTPTEHGPDSLRQAALRLVASGYRSEDLLALQAKLRAYLGVLDRLLSACDTSPGTGAVGGRTTTVLTRDPAEKHGDGRVREGLSAREREIVRLLASGQTIAKIATDLGIAPSTVRNHLKASFRKLGVHTQIDLINKAFAQGIVVP